MADKLRRSPLARIRSPYDVKRLTPAQASELAAEIRDFLVQKVSRTGGHLGPNLGAVEITLALHRVFDSPTDRILWDTGHQAYVHKILTGRQHGFDRLRQRGGLSGYPSQAESEHDIIENSHASTALSYADGMAKAYRLRGERRAVVAVVGDGALTGGMCWEALNNIAVSDLPVVIVVNDNGRSYAPTIGGLADHLASLRLNPGYEKALEVIKESLSRTPVVGPPLYDALHGVKRGLKDVLAPQGLFEDLGLKYVGPVDGHDLAAVEHALRRARDFGGPVIVHCVTRKGQGYEPAENDHADCLHGPGAFDPVTGRQHAKPGRRWTEVFADEMVAIGADRPDVVAITAAMLEPTGLGAFAAAYPGRIFDVGIAEQHAATSAAGLALGGLHPVVAVYATFLNRAYDQLLMDVALHRLPVTFVLDRAGVTGDDGPSHNGMWDLAILGVVPDLRIAAPRDEVTLRAELREAVEWAAGPTVVRYPKTPLGPEVPAVGRLGGVDVLRAAPGADVLLVSVGAMARDTLEVADRVAAQGIGSTVVDPRWVAPVDPALLSLAARHRLVVTLEDGVRSGGVGARLAQELRDAGNDVPTREVGIPPRFLGHGTVAEVKAEIGLTAQDIARRVVEWVSRLDGGQDPASAQDSSGQPAES
ncbi:MAG TPA: 1-deoxy-D-xylulose-5-phosphate synthase [Mycobacteriales bacterium]|nr:1-deoxy-D-xylulose-5-phosphate synthase [Mycobacteriales bacterium]